MKLEEMAMLFTEYYSTEGYNFVQISERKSNFRDINGIMILLNLLEKNPKYVSNSMTFLASTSNDEIYLSIDPNMVCEYMTPEIILDLVRCGIFYSQIYFCFYLITC